MSTMPGRRLERVTGSNNNPVTDPPSGLPKEMGADLHAVVRGFDRLLQVQWCLDVVCEQASICCGRHASEIGACDRTGIGDEAWRGGRLGRGPRAGINEQSEQRYRRFHSQLTDGWKTWL